MALASDFRISFQWAYACAYVCVSFVSAATASSTDSWKSSCPSRRFWCWECMSMSLLPRRRSTVMVVGVSFINARLFPLALSSRRMMHSSGSKSRSSSSKNCSRPSPLGQNVASSTHRCLPFCMAEVSARSPVSIPMAPRRILLPAPVSPVMTEKPSLRSMSRLSMSA